MNQDKEGTVHSVGPGDGRERILRAATALFAQRGFYAVSISDVAEEAGLVKSAIYHHFPSKEALYIAVLDQACRASRAEMEKGAKGKTWRERLRGATFVLAHVVGPRSHILGLIIEGITQIAPGGDPAQADAMVSLRREFVSVLSREIASGIAAGEIKRLDPDWAAACLIGLVASALQAAPNREEKERVSEALDLFFNGAASR